MKKYELKKESYKEKEIYVYDLKNITLLKKIIDNDYLVKKEFKNDNRTYVAQILIDEKKYILKKPQNNKVLKKILGIFKAPESLTVLKNTDFLKNEGFDELVNIFGTVIKKQNLFVKEEFYLMECVDGEISLKDERLKEILKVTEKIHNTGRYHGDCNPYNFLFNKTGVHVIDTKLKKMMFGNYRAHYDILTLTKYFKGKIEYPYKKNIFYYFAYIIRKNRR